MYLDIAIKYIDLILEYDYTDEEWFALEKTVNDFFASIPPEYRQTVDKMFITSGAGEMLAMICSGLRECV